MRPQLHTVAFRSTSLLLVLAFVASGLAVPANAAKAQVAAPPVALPPALELPPSHPAADLVGKVGGHAAFGAHAPAAAATPAKMPAPSPSSGASAPVGTLIIGGTPVRGTAPPVVRLITPSDTLGSCGGTLIGPFTVLTAAHCVTYSWDSSEYWTFWPGEVNVLTGTTVRGGAGGTRVPVVAIHVHPGYDPMGLHADAAVLLLASPQKGPYATLAGDPGQLLPEASARAFGWGSTGASMGPLRLLTAELHGVAPDICQAALDVASAEYPDMPWAPMPWTITDTMTCAGDALLDAGRTVCFGDSGGPLFTGSGAGMVQVGITSWTMDDCGGVAPAVFTDVGAVRDFVDPFTALSAPITIDLAKASWVDAVNLEAGAAGPCFVILTWQEAEPECPFMLSFRERSVTLWIAPPPGTSKTEVRVQAFTMDHLPLSTEWKLGVSPKAGVITKVTPDPKPCRATMVGCMDDVTVLRMKTDLSFAWVTIFDGADDETVCAYFTNYQMTGCSGPRAVALAGNAVAFFGPVPPLWTGGGGFDGWGTSVPMTPSLLLTAKPGLGTISDLTPKPVLSGAFYGLEIKVPKATSWEFAVYPADGGSPLDTCSVWTSVMDCDGAWWGLPGIIKGGAGRVFLPVAGPISKVDVEVLTYGPGGSQAGLSEGIQLVAGKITAVTPKFGPPVLQG